MHPVRLIFALHNHQPIGNFDSVMEEACERSYRPFLDVMARHPSVRFTQHWTGPLLEWLARHRPGVIELLRELVRRGQLELLTGAYYEAILPSIPDADRRGQIRKLSDTVERMFGVVPRGMWLAERVWEQQVITSIAAAGVEFVAVDDTHFRNAGLQEHDLRGYYVTEEAGVTLNVLPIDKTLRYNVPFRAVGESLAHLRAVSEAGRGSVVIHADDGEKFGVWPKTHAAVYGEGWLEAFCRMLEEHSAWLRTAHMADVVDGGPPAGRVYLPSSSYSEMMKWALPAPAFRALDAFERRMLERGETPEFGMFVRGGPWRMFLARYPEANHMHKKMLRLAARVERLRGTGDVPAAVLDHLWAGQCNDPYWHGVFGGLYLPNLRFPVYRNLLQAERELDRLERAAPLRVEEADFDCDGAREVVIESDHLGIVLAPFVGGAMFELDHKPLAFNLLDIVSRREEGYHRRLAAACDTPQDDGAVHDGVLSKEQGLAAHLRTDWYRRGSLIDHFLGDETTLDTFAACRYPELGDFVNQPYECAVRLVPRKTVDVRLERRGALWTHGVPHRVTVKKALTYAAGSEEYAVDYVISNGEETSRDIWFAVEFQAGLMAGDAHDRYYEIEGRPLADRRLRSTGEEADVRTVRIVDEWLGLETVFRFEQPATLWRFPVETVSLSEAGFERIYQSSAVVPHWKFRLDREVRLTVRQTVRRHSR
jgi:alpha-amylase